MASPVGLYSSCPWSRAEGPSLRPIHTTVRRPSSGCGRHLPGNRPARWRRKDGCCTLRTARIRNRARRPHSIRREASHRTARGPALSSRGSGRCRTRPWEPQKDTLGMVDRASIMPCGGGRTAGAFPQRNPAGPVMASTGAPLGETVDGKHKALLQQGHARMTSAAGEIADAPAGHGIGLGEGAEDDGTVAHPRFGRDGTMLKAVHSRRS